MTWSQVAAPTLLCLNFGIWIWYALVVRRMLNRKRTAMIVGCLSALLLFTVVSRLVVSGSYPPGFYEDEFHLLDESGAVYRGLGSPMAVEMSALFPVVLYAAMEGPVRGKVPMWWAIRYWPLICGMLSVLGMFAVAESLGCRPLGSLFSAGMMAVLPWSLTYGTVSFGGSILWHEMIFVWALIQFRKRVEVFILLTAIFAGTALLYDYYAFRVAPYVALLWIPFCGKRWWAPLVVFLGIAVLWIPALISDPHYSHVGLFWGAVIQGDSIVLADLWPRFLLASGTLYKGWTMADGSMGGQNMSVGLALPGMLVVLAVAGLLLADWWKKYLLCLLLLSGLAPAAVSAGNISSHRMMTAFVPVVLAAGLVVDKRLMLVSLLFIVIAYQSFTTFTSPEYWQGSNFKEVFDRWALPSP